MLLAIIVLAFVSVFGTTPVIAQSARMTISSESTTGTVGSGGVQVKLKLYTDGSNTSPSTNEKAELRIRSPREGDRCDTIGGNGPSNGDGYIFGACYATQTGSYKIYGYSHDKGDESAELELIFNAAPTKIPDTPTPGPTLTTEEKQKKATQSAQKKTSTTQSNPQQQSGSPLFGEGMIIETPQPIEKDDGLLNQKELVAGVSNSEKPSTASDGDLLKTLIFLTGAIILIIWTVYLILLQKGVIKKKPEPFPQAS